MGTEKRYSLHIVCLTAMFLLGSAVIVIPMPTADDVTFLGFIVSVITAVILSALLLPLAVKVFSQDFLAGGRLRRAAVKIFWLAVCVAVLADAAHSFGVFTDFVGQVILPDMNRWLVAAVLFGAAALPCVSHKSVVLKYSLFAFFITAGAIVFFLAASFSELRAENIILLRAPGLSDVAKQTVPYLLNVFLPVITVFIYVGLYFGENRRGAVLSGVVCGSALLGMCLLNTLLLFGASLSAELDFPYASAVGTITLSELFTRMDGVSYFIYFAAAVIKLTVCISVVKTIFARMGEKRERAVSLIFLALVAGIGLII